MAEEKHGLLEAVMDQIKTFYVTKIKGFGKTDLAVATLLFEGACCSWCLNTAVGVCAL
jgi:hypothetical protein